MEVRSWLGERESVSVVENIQRSLVFAWEEVRVNEAMRENCSLCMDLRRESVSSKESVWKVSSAKTTDKLTKSQ